MPAKETRDPHAILEEHYSPLWGLLVSAKARTRARGRSTLPSVILLTPCPRSRGE